MQIWTIIGISGQFGYWLADFLLKQKKTVWGMSRSKPSATLMRHKNFSYFPGDATKRLSAKTTQALQRAEVIVFSVPIGITSQCIRKIAPLLHAGQLITDVTSVKIIPLKAMLQYAPERVEILGIHPLFSPLLPLANKNIILVPERITPEKLTAIISLFEQQKAHVSIMTAREHDQMVAIVQALAHFLLWSFGKTLVDLKWDFTQEKNKKTTFYTLLRSLLDRVLSFDPALYAEIQLYNPEVPKVLKSFLHSTYKLNKIISNKREQDLKKMMQKIITSIPREKKAITITNHMLRLLEP